MINLSHGMVSMASKFLENTRCSLKTKIHFENQNTFFYVPIINSLAPGNFGWNFSYVIFKQILVIDGSGISCEIALIWMSLDFIDDQSTLVQVMAWCRQATSHYLSNVDPDLCRHMVSLAHDELTSCTSFECIYKTGINFANLYHW